MVANDRPFGDREERSRPGTGTGAHGSPRGVDAYFDALGHPTRRDLVELIGDAAPLSLDDAASTIAARERNVAVADVTEEHRDRLLVSLYHCHAPKLAASDVVVFDPARRVVEAGPNAERALAILERLETVPGLEATRREQ